MTRRALRLSLTLTAAVLATPAHAVTTTLSAQRSAVRECSQSLRPAGTRGIARSTYRVPGNGFTTVRLRGGGDWDLAVFFANGRRLGGAAGFGGREVVTVTPAAGRRIVVQACRRSGSGEHARVSFDFHRVAARSGIREPVQMLRVALTGPGAAERLEATGLDVTHNVTPTYADVVTYSAAERLALTRSGFAYTVRYADLVAHDRAQLRADLARTGRDRRVPSGRTAYREPVDFENDLKALADAHPGLVKPVEIGRSLEDRPIQGVEIARDVNRADDGRPVFAVIGAHHAREWPSAEMPMEFATDIAKGFGTDARVTSLLERVRVIAIPIMNPDGFAISRSVPWNPIDDQSLATLPAALADGAAYKRKNCRAVTEAVQLTPCASRPAVQGVDLNRNYGAFYGGVGSDGTNPSAQNYRGTGPFSEPEAEAFHKLSQTRNIVNVISHHTFTESGWWLRQPGFCPFGAAGCSVDEDVVPDEPAMKALGDAMGQATGWPSDLGWALSEITGATEDWNYFAASAFGYTPEQRGPNFHPAYESAVAAEYDGTAPGSAGGVREALLRSAEWSADPGNHSVIRGRAAPGATVKLSKSFDTPTSLEGVVVKDTLDQTLVVPPTGAYTWHVNPSTRPLSGVPEAYMLTCAGPGVAEAKAVTVARGQIATVDLCGGSKPGGSRPGSAPGGGVRPGATPARFTIRVRGRYSARRLNRSRTPRMTIDLTGIPVTAARLTLKRGKRTVARGSVRRITRVVNRVKLRRRGRLRAGTHTLEISARSAAGVRVRAKTRLRIRR